ncbi:SLBB domain-containing protein, partial [candidate division KSB1 bacterium]|nr:SLBB domain-containing protein [candidate division KSB1 bacterium]
KKKYCEGILKKIFCLLIIVTSIDSLLFAQDIIQKDQYIIGEDGKLQFSVHIWGEVARPGEYLVPDKTDVLELISKAGGPTEFSNLKDVKITRGLLRFTVKDIKATNINISKYKSGSKNIKSVTKIDLKRMLENEDYTKLLPILQPGDVVMVGKNTWYKWQTVIRVVSQLAIVAQVWWYWRRD